MDDDEILMRLDRESAQKTERARAMLIEAGRHDLVADLDKKLRDIRLGIDGARATWHALSLAQRRVLTIAGTGRRLRHSPGSRTQFDAYGEPHAMGRVCSAATVRCLLVRELIAQAPDVAKPCFIITERGRFVLSHWAQP